LLYLHEEELDELEDDLDEEILAQFRQARMSELQAQAEKEKVTLHRTRLR